MVFSQTTVSQLQEVGDFGDENCLPPLNLIRCTKHQLITEPLIFIGAVTCCLLSTLLQYDLAILSLRVIVYCVCRAMCWCIFIYLSVGKYFKNNFVCVGKASSFTIFGLCVGLCELQMCLLLADSIRVFIQTHGYKGFSLNRLFLLVYCVPFLNIP